jgi:hypothetical protein
MPEITSSKYSVQAGWDDVPHLDAKAKAELTESISPHLIEARSKGEPTLGSGAIYPIPIADVTCKPFAIPFGWKKAFALDVGWRVTAALWGAQNPSDGTIYLFSEHYMGHQLPVVHANAMKTRGEWIRGCIDPASTGSGQRDGRKLKDEYRSLGLDLVDADNELDAGLVAVWQALAYGQLKAFDTLQNWKGEYRTYQRNEKGEVKDDLADHLMDCMRYLWRTWNKVATLPPTKTRMGGAGITNADTRAGY